MKTKVFVGLDVHKDAVTISVLPEGAGEPTVAKQLSARSSRADAEAPRRGPAAGGGRTKLEGAAEVTQGVRTAVVQEKTARSRSWR